MANSILDEHGDPISSATIASLREEQATPTLVGNRPVWSGNPAAGLSPWRLAEILRNADLGWSRAYQELAEEIEERDLHYAGVLATRKRQVTQLPLTIEINDDDPAQVEHKALLETWIQSGALDDALFDVLDAIGKGFSVHEIIWRTDPGMIVPEKFISRPQRWFEVDRADGQTIMLRGSLAGNSQTTGNLFTPLAPHKFVVHRHPAKTGLVLRSGLARVALWAWMFKSFTMKDWAMFSQNYGAPVRVGRYGPEATESDKQVLWQAVSNIAGDCAAIIPRGMEIEFIESSNLSAGTELYLKRVEYLDQQISKLILGQTATTDAIAGGHAVGREHRLVQEDIERADARMLGTTIARQIFAPIIAFNFGPQPAYPRCRIGRPDEVPLPVLVDAVAKLSPLGLTLRASDVRDRLGMSAPEGDDEVIGGKPAGPEPIGPSAKPLPNDDAASSDMMSLRRLISRHATQADPDVVEALTERLAADAAGAMAGMTEQVRHCFDKAKDLPDLAHRLHKLNLDPAAFAEAMGRGLVLAQMAGQAALLDELHR